MNLVGNFYVSGCVLFVCSAGCLSFGVCGSDVYVVLFGLSIGFGVGVCCITGNRPPFFCGQGLLFIVLD